MDKKTVDFIVAEIGPLNNIYRDGLNPVNKKLEALWSIGDILIDHKIKSPHTFGWIVQKHTSGIIKRPTIFRSYKLRLIWPSKATMLIDIGRIKGLSNFIEMLPLIDPQQHVRDKLSNNELEQLFEHACTDKPGIFEQFVNGIKTKYSNGRLGHSLNKNVHLKDVQGIADRFTILFKHLEKIITIDELEGRTMFRREVSNLELTSFSNMCISLTTKDNFRLFKSMPPERAQSENLVFQFLFNEFRALLEKKSDIERARLRRLINATALADMSDLISSVKDEDSVLDFRDRKRHSFNL